MSREEEVKRRERGRGGLDGPCGHLGRRERVRAMTWPIAAANMSYTYHRSVRRSNEAPFDGSGEGEVRDEK
jgi:hypothetical protein